MLITNKSTYDYKIADKLEAGVVLTGAEAKSALKGAVNLSDSFVRIKGNEAYLYNAYISPYQKRDLTYDPKRERKLLLHSKEIEHLRGKLSQVGLTAIPLKMYTLRSLIKVEIGLGRRMRKYEKRDTLKRKALERDIEQTLREEKLKYQKH